MVADFVCCSALLLTPFGRARAQIRERDADLYESLEKVGFMHDWGDDDSGLFMKYLRRGSGYYIDVGAVQLLVDGKDLETNRLPPPSTCYYQLPCPPYTAKDVLKEQLVFKVLKVFKEKKVKKVIKENKVKNLLHA